LLDDKGRMNLDKDEGEKHWEVMERILHIYAKVNVGVSYTQGMNELLGPIYVNIYVKYENHLKNFSIHLQMIPMQNGQNMPKVSYKYEKHNLFVVH